MSDLNKTIGERVAKMLAMKPTMIHVAVNGVWSADIPNKYDSRPGATSTIFSYEKLDYHIGCREFLEGLRDAGIPFMYHGQYRL